MDLDTLSLKELKDLKARVDKAITNYEERKRQEALSEVEKRAREFGFSLSELTDTLGFRKRAPAAPKYANPEFPATTWTGRGRKPEWFQRALDAGMTPEDMLISGK